MTGPRGTGLRARLPRSARPAQPHSVLDYGDRARRRLPRAVFDFVDGGAEDEVTIARNRTAMGRLELVTRVLTDVSVRDQSTVLLGTPVASPLVLAPVGLAAVAHPQGERAAARAASGLGLISTLSSSSCWSLEEVAASCDGPKWFQVYVLMDRGVTRELVQRARTAGYRALCLTVDVPIAGRRERDLRNGFTIPPRPTVRHAGDVVRHLGWTRRFLADEMRGHGLRMGNFDPGHGAAGGRLVMMDMVNSLFDPTVGIEDLAWLRETWNGPLVVKGVLSASDARRCVEAGADAVWVSNHGGRQQDGVVGSADVLPEVVDAVGDRAEVYLDGGVRRGSDVVKALALGANACMVGRPWMYGLAAGGEAGVEGVLRQLLQEIDSTMALLGRPRLGDLDQGVLRPAQILR